MWTLLMALQGSVSLPVRDAGPARVARLEPLVASAFDSALFGHTLASDAGRLAVGAPEFEAESWLQGRVEFLERGPDGAWQPTFGFAVPELPESANGRVGWAVDLAGDLALVGAPDVAAPGPLYGAGRAWILERRPDASWSVAQTLAPPAPTASPKVHFGRAVALDGDQLAVTTQGASGTFVHRRTAAGAWELEAQLLPPDDADEGLQVVLEGDDLLVVGWEYVPDAYAFGVRHWRRTAAGWVDRGFLAGLSPEAGFNTSLALEDGRLAVGVPFDPTQGYKAGAVELFRRTPDGSFAHEATLFAPAAQPNDHFGIAVAWSDGALFAAAHLSDLGGVDRGAVWRFERVGGHWRATARAVGDGDPARFGFALAADREDLWIGVPDRSTAFDALLDGRPSGAVERWTRRPLEGAPTWISAAVGGTQTLGLDAGPDAAGQPYLVLGGADGRRPLLDRAGDPRLPFWPDAYTLAMAAGAGAAPWPGCVGVTDDLGRALAAIELPPLPPAAVGTVLHHAALVLADATPWPLVTDPVPLLLLR